MIRRFASVALAIALVCTIGGTSVLANTAAKPETKCDGTKNPAVPATTPEQPAKREAPANEKLKAGIAKLVSETKAGKGKLSAAPQMHPAKRNNLSKGTKIAIGVGVVLVVVAAILVIHARNHLFDDFNLNGLSIH